MSSVPIRSGPAGPEGEERPARFEDFRVEARVGQGGMGTVYRARGPDGALVALKVSPGGAHGRAVRVRQVLEVACLSEVRHPSVVRVLAHGQVAGRAWLAMEFVDGENLDARMIQRRQEGEGGMELDQVLEVGVALGNALAALAHAGVVHRDIKPANVILARGRPPVLVDFGLARRVGEELRLTRTGALVGTVDFAAPEQLLATHAGPPSDLYSLGLVLWYALTADLPVRGETAWVRALRRTRLEPPLLREVLPGAPARLEELLARMLHNVPEERRVDAGEVALECALLLAARRASGVDKTG